MGSFLKALEKVGLVELDAEDQARLEERKRERQEKRGKGDDEDLAELLESTKGLMDEVDGARAAKPKKGAGRPAAQKKAPPPPPAKAATGGPVAEGKPFADLYAAQKVPQSPYPAEKLLKLLDGLRAMEPSVRKTAILAMDEADEAWTVDDAVVDAQRKIRVLQGAKDHLAANAAAAETKAQQDLAAQDQYKQEATATIHQQIAELEKLLEEELKKVSDERAAIQSRLTEQRKAAARESHRLEQEIVRLDQVAIHFADTSFRTTEPSEGS